MKPATRPLDEQHPAPFVGRRVFVPGPDPFLVQTVRRGATEARIVVEPVGAKGVPRDGAQLGQVVGPGLAGDPEPLRLPARQRTPGGQGVLLEPIAPGFECLYRRQGLDRKARGAHSRPARVEFADDLVGEQLGRFGVAGDEVLDAPDREPEVVLVPSRQTKDGQTGDGVADHRRQGHGVIADAVVAQQLEEVPMTRFAGRRPPRRRTAAPAVATLRGL